MASYATIRELQMHVSALVETARGGQPLIVTNHGKPVAVLSAVEPETADQVALFLERIGSYQAYRALQNIAVAQKPLREREVARFVKTARRQP
ncbi:MAG: type II toxin-antitoxin system prevent-host-death family antitoxin [bacterium]|nr:type II toxin-antitoxin system prevent-host-death family antitoxin [bacterium]